MLQDIITSRHQSAGGSDERIAALTRIDMGERFGPKKYRPRCGPEKRLLRYRREKLNEKESPR